MEKEVLLKCIGICKSFGATKALQNVDLLVNKGEIRGLIGENGSGKSTISSIVAGVQSCDSGSIEFQGKPFEPTDMLTAQRAGISMIVQEAGTIPNISVMENIFVGKELRFKKGFFLNKRKMAEAAQEILNKIGAPDINAEDSIMKYNFEDRKLVEIARAMYDKPQLLIVDETTTALPQRGRQIIYNIMRKMAEEGNAVLFISHDMEELMEVCNAITVLRDGNLIATLEKDEMNVNKMRSLMIGREMSDNYYRNDTDGSFDTEVVLNVEHLSCGTLIEDISFQLHKGEILGIGGLSDCGMHDLGKAVFGAMNHLTGNVTYKDGTQITNPKIAIEKKIAYVSKNRDLESLILSDTIANNIALPSIPFLEEKMFLSAAKETKLADEQIRQLKIKCEDKDQLTSQLSGGNKQKVVFAKWLGNQSEILILDCPTRGIDIGVKVSMYQLMYQLKQEGKSIIMISEEMPELIGMSDRILIIKEGNLSGELERSEDLNERDVIQYMI